MTYSGTLEVPDTIRVEDDDRVRVISFNRPEKKNALDLEMRGLLTSLVREAQADVSIGAILLIGSGGNFCSGADVGLMKRLDEVEGRPRVEVAQAMARAIAGGNTPVVAAVEGVAFGAGLGLALACDYLVASTTSRFSAGFLNVGLGPDLGTSWFLPQRVGIARARTMMVFSHIVEADRALEIGLVDAVVAPAELREAGLTAARRLASTPPLAFAEVKRVYRERPSSLEEALDQETELQVRLTASNDFVEAFTAFREKRAPHFTGS